MDVLVFGGTSEGRKLVEWLDARGSCRVVACTATAYGASLLEGGLHVQALEGPLSAEAKRRLMESHDFACIVDATHPYALHISDSIVELAEAYDKDVVRIVRDGETEVPWTSVADADEAGRHLSQTEGNILLTTGTKDLATFVQAIPGFAHRAYVRILPVQASLARTVELGVPASHVIAMQGPFSEQLNRALIEEYGIEHLVTKLSGTAGGFEEKARAARACGIELVVLKRPRNEQGVSLEGAKALLEGCYGL